MKNYRYKPGYPCPGNDAIICPDCSRCNRCGWNPAVAEKRLAAVNKELKEKRRAEKHG